MKLRAIGIFVIVAVVAAMVSPAFASEAQELKARFKQRYPILKKLRDDGKVGETWEARAEAVKAEYLSEKVDGEKTLATFLAEENKDRDRLIALKAASSEISVEVSRRTFAKLRFDKAAADHWLKPKDKAWIQKKDIKEE